MIIAPFPTRILLGITLFALWSLTVHHASAGIVPITMLEGGTFHDFDFDGEFSDGRNAPGASSYIAYTDRGTKAARAGMLFDINGLTLLSSQSAYLRLTFHIAQNLKDGPNSQPPTFGPPLVELHGSPGDGFLTADDVHRDNLLSSFYASANSDVLIDISNLVKVASNSKSTSIDLSLRIHNDLDPLEHSEAWFYAEDTSPSIQPLLMIATSSVPEPSSLACCGVGAIMFGIGAVCRRKQAAQSMPGLLDDQID